MSERPELRLITRRHCHLCELVRSDLGRWAAVSGHQLREIDVDADPTLVALYGERVPVLLLGERIVGEGRFSVERAIREADSANLTVR